MVRKSRTLSEVQVLLINEHRSVDGAPSASSRWPDLGDDREQSFHMKREGVKKIRANRSRKYYKVSSLVSGCKCRWIKAS